LRNNKRLREEQLQNAKQQWWKKKEKLQKLKTNLLQKNTLNKSFRGNKSLLLVKQNVKLHMQHFYRKLPK
jgi:hypothetical protein